MTRSARTFQRPLGMRRYKKLFVISVEGSKTEPQYFAIFNQSESILLVKCLKRKSTESSPKHVLASMELYLRKESFKKTDQAWIVVDRDSWQEDQLKELLRWSKKKDNYGFALSNPKFEYWILLHFEDGKGISSIQECSARLKKYLPNYKKDIDGSKITLDHVRQAILRARKRSVKVDDLSQTWSTGVYKLVEKIIAL